MSQSIADSPIYKLRLQNILAKGAALGIKFLFSSQTFTTGVAGLTSTARAQIQQRIAMKGSKEEISETLELSSNLKTDQVRNWMEALPPHYALVKFRIGADTLPQVKRYLVMYFKDYAPRDQMIDQINASMTAIEGYDPSNIKVYQNKHPVLVDGNSYDAFDNDEFLAHIKAISEENSDYSGDEVFAAFGSPRLMEHIKVSALSSETRENILLLSRAAEQACAASIVMSVIKAFQLQGSKVRIWAYGKNSLFRAYRTLFAASGVEITEGMDAVCDAIRDLKKAITQKENANQLIVLLGMDRICMDFDFVDGTSVASIKKKGIADIRKGYEQSGAVVSSNDEAAIQKYSQAWLRKKQMLKREASAAGKTGEELKAFLLEEELKFRKEQGVEEIFARRSREQTETKASSESIPESVPVSEPQQNKGAYNAAEDFVYVMKQGSRLGYHFLMNLTSVADVKQCGLKTDYFRYKLAFQLSVDESRLVFNNRIASTLPEHICQFDDTLSRYSFRPYLHKGISWEGWYIDENGHVVSPYEETE